MTKSETTEQIEVFNWARRWESFEPRLKLLHHIPNEGKRQGSSGAMEKAMGMRAGVPDIFLPARGPEGEPGLYIEMKYGNNKPTKAQEDFMRAVRQQGYHTVVCYSADAAKREIGAYLRGEAGFSLYSCEDHILPDGSCMGMIGWRRCKMCKFRRMEDGKRA